MAFVRKLRALIPTRGNKLLLVVPWGTAPVTRDPGGASRVGLTGHEVLPGPPQE
jgi:hypothetical protein